LIFGSLKEWKKFNSGLITKEEFNKIKNSRPLLFIGSTWDMRGNRKFALDIKNNTVIFKQSKGNHHVLKIKTTNSRLKMLEKLQMISETYKTPITYRLSQDYVWITFDESVLKVGEHDFINNRIGALDMNPNYIAFTIQDFPSKKQIYKSIFNLTNLNQTHDKNKKDFEVVQIAKSISEIAKHYKVEIVGLEQIIIKTKDHKKGHYFNRLVNNTWNRNYFSNNLKKRLNILGIKNQEIVAAYSSTVGCLNHPDETDSVAAALEIGRRTYIFLNKFLNKNKEFLDVDVLFPPFNKNQIKERWNSILSGWNCKKSGWKNIHEYLKEQKKLNLLRFLFKDYDFSQWSCYRHKSIKSLVDNNFICV